MSDARVLVLPLGVLLACSPLGPVLTESPADAGAEPSGGDDGGELLDSGAPAVDGGPGLDGGSLDAGAGRRDAGCPPAGGQWHWLPSTLRSGHVATWVDGGLFVVGGVDGRAVASPPTLYDGTTFLRSELTDGGWVAPAGNPTCRLVTADRVVVSVCSTAAQSRRYSLDTGRWSSLSSASFLQPGERGFVVSMGSRVFVWDSASAVGASYDPLADVWAPLPRTGAPSAPCCSGVVWNGSRVLLWGGTTGAPSNAGFSFDPLTNTWATLPTAGAPSPRFDALVAANATDLVVWGGGSPAAAPTGGRLRLATGQWEPVPVGGPEPVSTLFGSTTAGMVGTKFIVLRMIHRGGVGTSGGLAFSYDLSTGRWAEVSTAGAPLNRERFSATFTDDALFLIGGIPVGIGPSSMMRGHVSRWSASTGTWSSDDVLEPPVIPTHALTGGGNATLVWADSLQQAVLFNASYGVGSAGRFDPVARRWQLLSLPNAPIGSYHASSVWTGSAMLTWGSEGPGAGATWEPASDTWSRWPPSPAMPSARFAPVAHWLGSRLFVWGTNGSTVMLDNRGGLFDPSTGTWRPTSPFAAPSPRSSVTTASALIGPGRVAIWGGHDGTSALGDGAVYDEASGTWTGMSMVGAPTARERHVAVWTGRELLVWGGSGGRTGAAWEALANTWRPISTVNAPAVGDITSGVWTGSRALFLSSNGTGGLYDPDTDSWSCLPTDGAPAFQRPLMVWTPQGALVLGTRGGEAGNAGALYVP